MRCHLETGSKTLATQDFRHATQGYQDKIRSCQILTNPNPYHNLTLLTGFPNS